MSSPAQLLCSQDKRQPVILVDFSYLVQLLCSGRKIKKKSLKTVFTNFYVIFVLNVLFTITFPFCITYDTC
jgi:hypothetical protein